MGSRKFTDIGVRNMRPGAKRREIRDPGQANLYLVLQPSGRRRYAVRYRFKGKPRKLTLSRGLSLAEASEQTTTAMAKVEKGVDPIEERKAATEKAAEAAGNTLRSVAQLYMELAGSKLRSARDRQSILDRLLLPRLGNKPIAEIERDHVTHVLDKVEIENGPRAADMALSVLRRIFSWHETRTGRFRSPLVRGMARLKPAERARKRVLSDDEIRRVWKACSDERLGIYGHCVRFVLLSAARRSEVSNMEWSEIEGDVWTLSKERSKPNIEVVRPLSKAAIAILSDVPQIAGSKYVFTSDGQRPIRLDAKRKRLLDAVSGTSNWVIHDLRRVGRSLLSRARVPYDIAEQCLGHKPPGGLLRQTYDQHPFLDEKREAFEKLAAEVERIISPP